MMDLYSEDIELLKELYLREKVDFYFFHEKYKLSPAQLGRTLKKFKDAGLIVIEEQNIILNEIGIKWIIGNRRELFLKEKSKYWKNIPDEMTQEILGINDIYIPNRKKIDKEIFKNLEDGK